MSFYRLSKKILATEEKFLMQNDTIFIKYRPIIYRMFLIAVLLTILTWNTGFTYAVTIQTGVIATAAPDYSSYAISTISVDPKTGPRTCINNLLPGSNGSTVKAFGNYYYRIEQFQADSVTKVDISAPNTPIWQYSTQDEGETTSSNPWDLVFVNSTKAYLIRYGSTKAWIVNPSATSEAGFKIGELDLSAYTDVDGVPNMCCGVIAGNKLFIVMQRLVDWCPTQIAYVAVFDTATDIEINTGMGSEKMIGIPLAIKNPRSIQYLADNNLVYVQGSGAFPGGTCDPVYEYTGGIESINPLTYASSIVLDDGDAQLHPYGAISGMAIASSAKGYFIGYAGWGDNTLYCFNPSTGSVTGALEGFRNKNLGDLDFDMNEMLWVCDLSNSVVKIVDTTDNRVNETIHTNLIPQAIAFCRQEVPYYYVEPDGKCGGDKSPCYSSISEAVSQATSGSYIMIGDGTYSEEISLNAPKELTLQGGWNTSFTSKTGTTTLKKAPKAQQGAITLQMLTIKP